MLVQKATPWNCHGIARIETAMTVIRHLAASFLISRSGCYSTNKDLFQVLGELGYWVGGLLHEMELVAPLKNGLLGDFQKAKDWSSWDHFHAHWSRIHPDFPVHAEDLLRHLWCVGEIPQQNVISAPFLKFSTTYHQLYLTYSDYEQIFGSVMIGFENVTCIGFLNEQSNCSTRWKSYICINMCINPFGQWLCFSPKPAMSRYRACNSQRSWILPGKRLCFLS